MDLGRPAGALPARIGRYQILERIGKGAMGVVYSARDGIMDRVVAIKVMMADLEGEPDTRTRFYREAQAAGRLLHPNIITIFDMGEDEGRIYMVMELLKGLTLTEFLHQPGVSIEQKVGLMVQTCEGLAAAHAKEIVHRDIKPGNLFVLADGNLKILDFGVARLASSTMTASGFIIGTPDYMSPEQARGAEIDPRSDIFSSAAVFYFMLSGRKPFAARDLPTVLRKVQTEPPVPLSEQEAPPALARIVMRSLSKDPAERHQSMAELASDLSRFRRHYEGETRQLAMVARERFDAIQNLAREESAIAERLRVAALGEPPTALWLRDTHPAFVERAPELLLVPFSRPEITEIADKLAAEREEQEQRLAGLRRADTAVAAAARALEEGRPEDGEAWLGQAADDLPDTAEIRDLQERCSAAAEEVRTRRARREELAEEARRAAAAEDWVAVFEACEDAATVGGGSEFDLLRLRAREAIDRAERERTRAQQRALDRARRGIHERRFDLAVEELEQARRLEAPADQVEQVALELDEARRAAAAEEALARKASEAIALARSELHAGRPEEALSVLRECLAAEPGVPNVQRELVRMEDEIRRQEEARRRLAEEEAARERTRVVQHELKVARQALRGGYVDAAQSAVERALAASPGDPHALALERDVAAQRARMDEARRQKEDDTVSVSVRAVGDEDDTVNLGAAPRTAGVWAWLTAQLRRLFER